MHISRYIIEHCRHLCLLAEEISAQIKLPVEPLPPPPVVPLTTPSAPPPSLKICLENPHLKRRLQPSHRNHLLQIGELLPTPKHGCLLLLLHSCHITSLALMLSELPWSKSQSMVGYATADCPGKVTEYMIFSTN